MAEPKDNGLLMWVDVETTGLNPRKNWLLEVGLRVTDYEGQLRGEIAKPILPAEPLLTVRQNTVKFVDDMHEANGLWHDCVTRGLDVKEAEKLCMNFTERMDMENTILCGSSHTLDRNFLEWYMPKLFKMFHYRVIDNSSTKELCKRLNPELFAKVPDFGDPTHRVVNCLDATVAEYNFYRENFLIEGDFS